MNPVPTLVPFSLLEVLWERFNFRPPLNERELNSPLWGIDSLPSRCELSTCRPKEEEEIRPSPPPLRTQRQTELGFGLLAVDRADFFGGAAGKAHDPSFPLSFFA